MLMINRALGVSRSGGRTDPWIVVPPSRYGLATLAASDIGYGSRTGPSRDTARPGKHPRGAPLGKNFKICFFKWRIQVYFIFLSDGGLPKRRGVLDNLSPLPPSGRACSQMFDALTTWDDRHHRRQEIFRSTAVAKIFFARWHQWISQQFVPGGLQRRLADCGSIVGL